LSGRVLRSRMPARQRLPGWTGRRWRVRVPMVASLRAATPRRCSRVLARARRAEQLRHPAAGRRGAAREHDPGQHCGSHGFATLRSLRPGFPWPDTDTMLDRIVYGLAQIRDRLSSPATTSDDANESNRADPRLGRRTLMSSGPAVRSRGRSARLPRAPTAGRRSGEHGRAITAVLCIPGSGDIGQGALADELERQTPIWLKLPRRWAAHSVDLLRTAFTTVNSRSGRGRVAKAAEEACHSL
jgi:hypothetical protein